MESIIIYILLSLLLSAFFSGSEVAFITSSKLFFEFEKRKKNITSSILSIFYKKPNQFISTMLIGNNIALVVYGLLMARLLNPYLREYISSDFAILLIQSLIAATLILFAGEFIPKVIARISPNMSLSFFSIPLFLSYIILYPISKLGYGISWLILKVFGVNLKYSTNKTFGKEDLDYFIQKTIEEAPHNAELGKEVKLFQNALEFSNVRLRDCIVPRTEIVALDINTSVEELLSKFIETGLSKILVYREDIDNILGYIHSSELFNKPKDWTERINPLPVVPENMAANKLMKDLLKEKKSMAIVVDEFGGTTGLITLEDLVEEIFGEIEDEHDTNILIAKKISEKEFVLSGRMEIDKLNESFELGIPESEEYVTLAGYILNQYQNFPKANELINIGKYTIKIIKVTTTKIELVRLKLNE